MKTFKCDVCGQYYDHETYIGRAHDFSEIKYNAQRLEDNRVVKTYDLCPVCMQKLREFLEGDRK